MSDPGNPFHPSKNPVLPEPNKIYDYQIGIWPIFYTFKEGHKIWAQIAGIDYGYQNHLNTIYASETVPFPVANNIYHDLANPSHLILPIIPDATIIKPLGPLISQIMWAPEV
jgi:predicted acyl esterase